MGNRSRIECLPIGDVNSYINRKVNLIGVIHEFGLPKTTKSTDYCCILRIIDETHNQRALSVIVFAEKIENLPRVAAAGDVVQFHHVMIRKHQGEVNAVFYKGVSSFALYKGNNGDDFAPYQASNFCSNDEEDKMLVAKLRRWLVNFQRHEDSSEFPMFREIKEDYINLACKILHCCEAAKDRWFIFAWDGTDTPPKAICSELEDELNSPLPLQLEPVPLTRELLCTFPTVGSILRISCDQAVRENHLLLRYIGKWVKLVNIRLEVRAGLWHGVFSPQTKFRYAPNEDSLIVERQRLSAERISLKSERMLSWSFPMSSCVTVVDHDRAPLVTLMDVLTHSEVTGKFKCIVRVVAAVPVQADWVRNAGGIYRMRLTLEDPTARIHASVLAEDGETLFDGYPGVEKMEKILNKLLGITEYNAPRNPPWVCVCLVSYDVSETDSWESRYFAIFDTKIVGDV